MTFYSTTALSTESPREAQMSSSAEKDAECVECRKAEDVQQPAEVTRPKEEEKEKKQNADVEGGDQLPAFAPALPSPGIIIEYCDRCRWQARASWIQTELFLTFPCPKPRPLDAPAEEQSMPLPAGLRSITILPRTAHDEGGIFRVWLTTREGDDLDPAHLPPDMIARRSTESHSRLLWDRKTEGRFPEPKELKQQIRDVIAPKQSLGHSDRRS
ncbi:hypothetical protein V8E36_008223 [Tilletia maclaganii]